MPSPLYLLTLLMILSAAASASDLNRIPSPPSSGRDDVQKEAHNLKVAKVPTLEETIASDDHRHSEEEEHQDENGQPLGELTRQPTLQCYQCNSLVDGNDCSDSEAVVLHAAKFLKHCPELKMEKGKDKGKKSGGNSVVAAVGCWKLSQKVDYTQGPDMPAHYRVIRRCAYLGQEEASCASHIGYGTSTKQCFCSTSQCNGASTLFRNGFSIFTRMMVVIVVTLVSSSQLLSHLF